MARFALAMRAQDYLKCDTMATRKNRVARKTQLLVKQGISYSSKSSATRAIVKQVNP